MTVKIGVVGYGYWGPNIVRNFAETPGAQLVAVSDLRDDKRALVERRYPGIRATRDAREIFAATDIDAVAIATPVGSHYELALAALRAGKHVLVEKPMTADAAQARHLIEEAEKRGLTLMVDHTFCYTGAVRKMKEMVETGELGDLYYYDSLRVNLGLFQHDVNVIWDLAVHDLSILEFVVPHKPLAVSAVGMSHVPGTPENLAYITVFYDSPFIAHVNVNWLAPVKVRKTLLGGSRKMAVYDDLEPSEKLKVYDKGITTTPSPEQIYQMLVGYRSGDMWAPQLAGTEALSLETRHFIDCIKGKTQPVTDGAMGLGVVEILAAASQSMALRGQPVDL
ncbi:hypothetical protein CCC_00834 [Paramagnetospirillum magnetotacticum MS-1]|uniref:Oxidoreductase n=1 Tax=Paramagnetospirillum magnetotacticum MS-1 TaxID=272627 RepID=A0A0C2YRL5_PARME|nr:Gfo/Idh/MocA family oxidoreductase [Paramagnetospirillum magnetotacticum]KIL97773.1 hypothetical protein CCC_00834 [Paramagnetospirillum magnetotacticum MS-1]